MLNKTKKVIVLMVLLLVMISLDINNYQANPMYEEREVMLIWSERSVSNKFLENPSMEILEQSERTVTTPIRPDLRFIGLRVDSSLYDFVRGGEGIELFLSENGVVGEIEKISILTGMVPFNTIWVKVNSENFFITIYEKFDYVMYTISHVYSLYTHYEYLERFKERDAKLIVNGVDITEGNYVKIQYRTAFLPLRAIMEELGAEVIWDRQQNAVYMLYDEGVTFFSFNSRSFISSNEPGFEIMAWGWGGIGDFIFSGIIDGRTIMSSTFNMEVALDLVFGRYAQINIDFEDLIITITTDMELQMR